MVSSSKLNNQGSSKPGMVSIDLALRSGRELLVRPLARLEERRISNNNRILPTSKSQLIHPQL
jgi:hypothetical protein